MIKKDEIVSPIEREKVDLTRMISIYIDEQYRESERLSYTTKIAHEKAIARPVKHKRIANVQQRDLKRGKS